MDTTPEASTVKRTRAKPKAAKEAISAKKPRSARNPAAKEAAAVEAVKAAAMAEPAIQDLSSMIATAAYYLAAERNFAPGHELDDWLEAERRVRTAPLG